MGNADEMDGFDHESLDRMPMLLDAVLGIGTDLELRATLQHIVETAADLIGARYGALGVLDPERGSFTDLFTSGVGDTAEEDGPGGPTGLLGLLTDDPRLRLEDLTSDPRSGHLPPGHDGTDSFLGVPIKVESEVFGNLFLTEKLTGTFTTEDQALLRVLASQAGIAIGNARLYGIARQRERWIEGAASVTTSLLTGETAADALMTVAESARVLADASAGIVLLPTEDGGMKVAAASSVDGHEDMIGTTIRPASEVLVNLLGGEPVFIEDSASAFRRTTPMGERFGPVMMLPLQSGGKLIGTLVLPRPRDGRPYSAEDRLLARQFASQAALALVLADAQHDREQLAVYEDRDRIARDLHDLVVQRLFATAMMLESTKRRTTSEPLGGLLERTLEELDSTIQEVRTTIFTLQQPPMDVPGGLRGQVLRETSGAAALLGFRPSVGFRGPVDSVVGESAVRQLLATLRGALAAAHRRAEVTVIDVRVDATVRLPDGRLGVRLTISDDGLAEDGELRTSVTWQAPR